MDPSARRIALLTQALSASLGGLIALGLPLAYLVMEHHHATTEIRIEAELAAEALSELASANPGLWLYQELRIVDLLESRIGDAPAEVRSVFDDGGALVLERGGPLSRPRVSRSAIVYDSGHPAGRIEVTRSLAPVLRETTLVAAVSLLFGGALYAILSVFPLRTLRRTLKALKASQSELETRGRVAEAFLSSSDEEVYSRVLAQIREALASPLGFFGYIDEAGALVSPSLTRDVWDLCRVTERDVRFPHETWAGIWGQALREGRSLVSRGPFSVPEGHVPIRSALSVPLLHRGAVIGLVTVANKPGGYGRKDVRLLEAVASYTAPILSARLRREEEERARKQAEEELVEARDAAESANRLKGQFLASISHELRTPMNSILGYTELLLDEVEGPLLGEQRQSLERVLRNGRQLLRLIDEILDLSRLEAHKLRLEVGPFRLRELLGETVRSLGILAGRKGLTLDYAVAPEVPDTLLGDGDRLTQVLRNLLDNGIKFTETGGIDVRVDVESEAPGAVGLHFTVRDTGVGVPAEQREAIFGAFVQADAGPQRPHEGVGLGLAICSLLVRLMAGRIWVEPAPTGGSAFHFTARFGVAPGGSAGGG